jgi:hypothetical protein
MPNKPLPLITQDTSQALRRQGLPAGCSYERPQRRRWNGVADLIQLS